MQHQFNCKTYFHQDEHKKFTVEDAPKYYAKRTYNSISKAYSSSFNPLCTHMSSQYNPSSPTLLHRPIDQKAVKINEIKKLVEIFTTKIKLTICKINCKKVN